MRCPLWRPLNEQGQRVDLWVVGMGKLGGRELNVSSDIDLIYVYEDDGLTTGVDDGRGVSRARSLSTSTFRTSSRRSTP